MIIGLTGRKQSGKDTAAEILKAQGYEAISFAEPMKLMLAILLGLQGLSFETVDQMLNGDLKEVPTPYLGGRSPRYAMQTLGTEWGRNQMGGDFWVNITMNRAVNYDDVVITDVRFPNELTAIHGGAGEVYRIVRPDRPVGEGETHPSESFIDTLDVDGEIINDRGIEDFQDRVYEYFFVNT